MVDEALLINVAFTVVGALFGAAATLIVTRLAWQSQSYNEAASTFRSYFVEQIHQLRKGDVEVHKVLDDSVISRHESAKIIFEPFFSHVNSVELRGMEIISPRLKHSRPGILKNREEEIKRALSKIARLMACAARK